MNKEKDCFLVRGRFAVYDGKEALCTTDYYINEYISAAFGGLARRIGIRKAEERAASKYGKAIRLKEIRKVTAEPASKEKCRERQERILKKMIERDQEKLF